MFLGFKITSCKTEGLKDKPWCSTATDTSGNHIAGEGNYGECPDSEKCKAEECVVMTDGGPAEGSPCVFPFNFGGETYEECIEWTYGGEYAGTMWCSTK